MIQEAMAQSVEQTGFGAPAIKRIAHMGKAVASSVDRRAGATGDIAARGQRCRRDWLNSFQVGNVLSTNLTALFAYAANSD